MSLDMLNPALSFIPHRPPIVFIDSVVCVDKEIFCSFYTVPSASPYLDEHGYLMPECLLEIMAQCFAAGAGMRAHARNIPVSWGYLAAIKNMRILTPVRAGETVRTEVCQSMRIGPVHVLECSVTSDKRSVAAAQLKIFIPEADS